MDDMEEKTAAPVGAGYLIVQVTTANTAIPLAGATVRISRDDAKRPEVLYNLISGSDGRTEKVRLEAPPRKGSLAPSDDRVYGSYNIEVSLAGYEGANYLHIPIYDGITAIQQANLVPLPENGYPDHFTMDDPRRYEIDNDSGL